MDFQNLIRFGTPRCADDELHTNTQYAVDFVFLPIRVYRSPKRVRCLSIQTPFLGFFLSQILPPPPSIICCRFNVTSVHMFVLVSHRGYQIHQSSLNRSLFDRCPVRK